MKKPGGFAVWYEPFTCYRTPKLYNLRMDPYERADVVSEQYDDWRVKNAYLHAWLTFHAAAFLDTFVECPPSRAPGELHDRSDRERRRATDPRDGRDTRRRRQLEASVPTCPPSRSAGSPPSTRPRSRSGVVSLGRG